jgi:thiosulfate/3-mercaptopyruvate sulfurtransferase
MSKPNLPLIVEPETLEEYLGYQNLLIVDLGKADTYRKMHIPGAVHLEYPQILGAEKPKMGLLPDDATLAQVLSSIGIDEHTHVVAYDDEGGGRASRLLWTLEVAGHTGYSLLNGGLHAWANEGHPLDDAAVTPVAKTFTVRHNNTAYADTAYIIEHLENPDCCLLDVRSPDEFNGVKKFADRAGHIPGAVNMEWTSAMDPDRNLRLKGSNELTARLAAIGVTPDREVVVYCQTHHRSAHTFIMLKSLGFQRIKGYPGSWSVWGNSAELPVE